MTDQKQESHICCMNDVDKLGRVKCTTCGKSDQNHVRGTMRKERGDTDPIKGGSVNNCLTSSSQVSPHEQKQEELDCASCYPDDCEKCQLIIKIRNEERSRHEKEITDLYSSIMGGGSINLISKEEVNAIFKRVFGGEKKCSNKQE